MRNHSILFSIKIQRQNNQKTYLIYFESVMLHTNYKQIIIGPCMRVCRMFILFFIF